ncbi:hypothetical protein BX281_1320 [Streptomyces sp. Ag82_O1-15]|nr:hypothetical protein BX281_1320 [Streptomyces sp. Ag82_O1-15]
MVSRRLAYDPTTRYPCFGAATFGSAIFTANADFRAATFHSTTEFESAAFQRTAWFVAVTFQSDAWLGDAAFQRDAGFFRATFQSHAGFQSVTFRGDAKFGWATFEGHARFGSATFQHDADFGSAAFQREAQFGSATFQRRAHFGSATFAGRAQFESVTFAGASFPAATFQGYAGFRAATFAGAAWFELAAFERAAEFKSAVFRQGVGFGAAAFQQDAWFEKAILEQTATFGPLTCAGTVVVSGAVFRGPVTLLFAARRLECQRARWSSTAELRLRYAAVDFGHALFEYPLTISAEPAPFVHPTRGPVAEQDLAGTPDAGVRLMSLQGVDAAHLVLTDVDLAERLFARTVHLDQIRLEGLCTFAGTPPGTHWRRWRIVRFTPRRTLAEEHHWRASQPSTVPGWSTSGSDVVHVGPPQLALVYRALRKALEDGKDEPGAADFYYGEMEMRRHDRARTSRAERGLLHGYWLLSGYGLRASRALGWLAAMMFITVVLLMGFGLPKGDPQQEATGTVPRGGGKVTYVIGRDDPQNPSKNKFTGQRFEKALNVTLNSVVFRSSDQDLTTSGTYIEMTSRLSEPILLGLAAMAVRNRVKR